MADRDYMVITGAGDGIMGAANFGAGREASFGLAINLPFEAGANATAAAAPSGSGCDPMDPGDDNLIWRVFPNDGVEGETRRPIAIWPTRR